MEFKTEKKAENPLRPTKRERGNKFRPPPRSLRPLKALPYRPPAGASGFRAPFRRTFYGEDEGGSEEGAEEVHHAGDDAPDEEGENASGEFYSEH